MSWELLPIEIDEIVWEYEFGPWPGIIEIPRPGRGKNVYKYFRHLTPGDCEQCVEFYTRRATRAVRRFEVTGSPRSAETAAWNIFLARVCRTIYHQQTGHVPENHAECEQDMPFPELTDEEAASA